MVDAGDKPLTDVNGKPIQDQQGFLLPHYRTFAAIINQYNKTYFYRWDEALKHSKENALGMRRDCYIVALLRERYYQLINLGWHLECDDENNLFEKDVTNKLTQGIREIPRWRHFLRAKAEAIWYGRYGSQVKWDRRNVDGQGLLCVTDHIPVNGDKIQWGFDGVPRVMIYPGAMNQLPGAQIIRGDLAPMLVLSDPRWRQRFVIHRHEIDDADYFDIESAGALGGTGVRNQIYWCWWMRDELLGWAMNFMRKLGTLGLFLFYYDENNTASKTAAENAAKDVDDNNALAVPRPRGSTNNTSGAELIPANPAGVKALQDIISQYFERQIERLIVGQSMSAGADHESGLGGSGRAKFAMHTKLQILKWDADNLADTLTTDLIAPMMQWNYPQVNFRVRFKFDVPDPDSKEKLDATKVVVEMGVECKADEVRSLAGMSKPAEGDETVGGSMMMAPGEEPDGGFLVEETSQSGKSQDGGDDKPDQFQRYSAEFEEKHPRGEGGKFAETGHPEIDKHLKSEAPKSDRAKGLHDAASHYGDLKSAGHIAEAEKLAESHILGVLEGASKEEWIKAAEHLDVPNAKSKSIDKIKKEISVSAKNRVGSYLRNQISSGTSAKELKKLALQRLADFGFKPPN